MATIIQSKICFVSVKDRLKNSFHSKRIFLSFSRFGEYTKRRDLFLSLKFLHRRELFKEEAFWGGSWKSGDSAERIFVNNPASLEVLGSVPSLGSKETLEAIQTSVRAFSDWSNRPAKERSGLIRNWAEKMKKNREDLAILMTLEQGKPLDESRNEIDYAFSFLEWFSEESKRIYGDIVPSHRKDTRIEVFKQPVGVCGILTPWNFPSSMITRKAAAALAVGCTVICKPSELTPFSALALAALAQEAGIPEGVFQILTGYPENIANTLIDHTDVKKISFTGSTRVGKLIMERSSKTLKRLSLELGGNAPFLIFDDANLEAAVKGAILSKFRNSGQTCVCTNRFLVQKGIYKKFLNLFSEAVLKLKVGNGFEKDVNIGPLINEAAVRKMEIHVENAKSTGAKLIVGGGRIESDKLFFSPTIFSEVKENCLSMKEEIFGPIAPIYRFESIEEAIQIANSTPSGLAAYVYTEDYRKIGILSERIESGMLGINEGLISSEQAPFGGVKESGFGREGSKYGIDEYLNVKYVCIGGF
ncbi:MULTISPECIES: NAD-dependent succinate-semialdehyde dehydrogenase [Leptospira]|uniref:NAD-dependent succinate-semialdehyde dehydrogenase n=1 Tax=Leptospira TaxID=171 RepID=UPI00029260F5|nr:MULTISPECIES: NAD-dependent succinate-semialdehyde dehydrogenase [Leptospira]EKO77658.1 succinate-semialdehyde dehydrogenase [NAD(P)+] [Leptospira sp. Fiocruz LV3954]EMI65598.1 succinate-semialdehyde dehydrogenase [NAD(P)+] [Leptospira sp. Fiocruz LV4135]EMO72886.1 succinate-semialdehyde dehydrogenase [NAD(P)+] [Leptospira santarosai str. 200403458]EMO98483.1 succinate-semialdehyde dehydrogenase [NAD(P)+] [Leptospira santarosai str. 200702252]